VEAQGADLRRFDKHKKRVTLGTRSSLIWSDCVLEIYFCG
jgi:hypothetical protein